MHSRARPSARILQISLLAAAVLFPAASGATAAEPPPGALDRCRLTDTAAALAACEQAVKRYPDSIEAKRLLAKSLIEIGDFDASINVYAAIARARPDDADALADLGGALGFVRRYDEAAEAMEKVLRLKPNDVTAHRAAAIIYAQLGRDDDMVRVTARAAGLGDTVSMFDMAEYCRTGKGVARDDAAALGWAVRAADGGHLGALELMVRINLDGLWGQAPDEAKAREWAWKLRRARNAGATRAP